LQDGDEGKSGKAKPSFVDDEDKEQNKKINETQLEAPEFD